MVPKPINHKYDHFKSGFNGLAIVDYSIYNPIYDNCYLDIPAIRNIQHVSMCVSATCAISGTSGTNLPMGINQP